jgi:hypothetical protein
MENEKEIIKEIESDVLLSLGYSNNEVSAIFDSVFYEDELITVDDVYALRSKHNPKIIKSLGFFKIEDLKFWLKEKLAGNDTYFSELEKLK